MYREAVGGYRYSHTTYNQRWKHVDKIDRLSEQHASLPKLQILFLNQFELPVLRAEIYLWNSSYHSMTPSPVTIQTINSSNHNKRIL